MYLGGDQLQTHAFQVTPLLTEDKVLLLGFGNDELELDLLPQHGWAEGEGMEGALWQLKTSNRACMLRRISGWECMGMHVWNSKSAHGADLCSGACLTVMLTLFTVVKGIVGREPGQTYGLGLPLGWYFSILPKVFRVEKEIRHIINYTNHLCSMNLLFKQFNV